jgi:formate C-acetyltransferase
MGNLTRQKKHTYTIKTPENLSPRIQWLRDYYFSGVQRAWNNEATAWTTGTPWDFQYEEFNYYIVPETYTFFPTFKGAFKQVARPVDLHPDFWKWSIAERKAWFLKQVMVNYLPQELLPGDLIAGGRFNIQTSTCLDEAQAKAYLDTIEGKDGLRQAVFAFHNHGYGNAGCPQPVPGYDRCAHTRHL